jgi:hypothetical protein
MTNTNKRLKDTVTRVSANLLTKLYAYFLIFSFSISGGNMHGPPVAHISVGEREDDDRIHERK